MRGAIRLLLVGWIAVLVGACGSQIVRAPLNPYVAPDLRQRNVRQIAVLPVLVPSYLSGQGGEGVSVDLTNQFLTELAARRLYDLVAGDRVTEAIAAVYGNPREWIYEGNTSQALKIGRELKVQGVIVGQVRRYVQAHLDQSEFEVQFDLIDVSSMETLWSVRELMIGKGGTPGFGRPVTTPPARRLAEKGVQGAADRISQIIETGGPIKVAAISNQTIAGYSLISAGAVSTVIGVYYVVLSKNYQQYQKADDAADLSRLRNNTEEYDQMWMIFGSAGLALLGGGLALVLTDPALEFAAAPADAPRVAMAPVMTPRGFALAFHGRF
jgi:TolB-like protein